MNKKWLNKFIKKLNRSDGTAIMAFIAMIMVMTIMGGAFASIVGGWRMSAPYERNSNRASQLASSAATFALQEAKNDIGTLNYGTHLVPFEVYDDGNGGIAEYWIEMPLVNDDDTGHPNDDEVDDDDDDFAIIPANINLHTIIASGRVENGDGDTVARRQVKIFVEFIP